MIVEDAISIAHTFAGILEGAGHHVQMVETGGAADDAIAGADQPFDIILLDLQLPDYDGLEWLEDRPGLVEKSTIIVVTADGSINRAITAMRLGAYDFLVKPVAPPRLLTTVRNAFERQDLVEKVETAQKLVGRDTFQGFIGKSPSMQVVYRAIENVARSAATVFITGESGTGKEVAAEAIHNSGQRARKRFVAINCGAIPENLLESEIFGHVKGSFTGAVADRKGAAREAHGGTLFLDEICEMDLALQVKLLRFLQTGMVQPVGSNRPEAVDVRVLCATNRNPALEVAEGRFREDLFYRLAVIPLELPPLREREGDIGLIAQTFLDRFAAEEGKAFDQLAPDILASLQSRRWPGNVRELQNTIRRIVVMNPGPVLELETFARDIPAPPPAPVAGLAPHNSQSRVQHVQITDYASAPAIANGNVPMTLADAERQIVEAAIERAGGSIPKAAVELDVSPSTIYRMRGRWNS
ncbi:ATPase AAA [Aurantiacibacter marinus]|uniref:ATPase AAA n=1 Tax=Aurantiacibacter marinus TaxID=874156 RepID=A0A0H0XXU9_9SPHN|nr:ATPase AAA [Aurantiacibacter marinus]